MVVQIESAAKAGTGQVSIAKSDWRPLAGSKQKTWESEKQAAIHRKDF